VIGYPLERIALSGTAGNLTTNKLLPSNGWHVARDNLYDRITAWVDMQFVSRAQIPRFFACRPSQEAY
jgi:hypothetical protein